MTDTPTSAAVQINPSQPPPLPLIDVAELLARHYGLNEGLWELALEMQVTVGQIGATPETVLPGAVIGVSRIGLTRVPVTGPRTIDAAKIAGHRVQASSP